MLTHALDPIPEDLPPREALARAALADPLVGPTPERARRIAAECQTQRAEALVVSRIPGASHCAREGTMMEHQVQSALGRPSLQLADPRVADLLLPALETRLQALMEAARYRRNR